MSVTIAVAKTPAGNTSVWRRKHAIIEVINIGSHIAAENDAVRFIHNETCYPYDKIMDALSPGDVDSTVKGPDCNYHLVRVEQVRIKTIIKREIV